MSIAPKFTKKPSLRQDGKAVVFSCEIEAAPKPDTKWYRGDTPLEASDRLKFSIDPVDGKENTYTLTMTVDKASGADSGSYKVEVSNAHGKMAASANLNLQGRLRLRLHTPTGRCVKNTTVPKKHRLICVLFCRPFYFYSKKCRALS